MNLSVFEFCNSQSVLAGSERGRQLLGRLVTEVGHAESPTICLVNFDSVEVATASFLRESVLAFRDYCRRSGSQIYPILANLSPAIREELNTLLKDLGDVVLACSTDERMHLGNAEILGILEEKQRLTYELVAKRGIADARSLWKACHATDPVKITAWNNRLAALAGRGLLIEEFQGKTKIYRPVLEAS